MKFAELKIGEVFQFDFDRKNKAKWVYEKISEAMVKTVGTCKAEQNTLGQLFEISELLLKADCHIIPGC